MVPTFLFTIFFMNRKLKTIVYKYFFKNFSAYNCNGYFKMFEIPSSQKKKKN